MKAIGPYVVVREVSPAAGSGAAGHSARTLLATDRVTGIPALLHEVTSSQALPEQPRSTALLPFVDRTEQEGAAYLITELPPHAVPASDPLLTATGALDALSALHGRGLAHGALDTGQLWSVDGQVRLAGGGRHSLGGEYSAARDLRDLGRALETLGGLPPGLEVLRDPPASLSAQELRRALAGAAPEQPTPVKQPVPADFSLDIGAWETPPLLAGPRVSPDSAPEIPVAAPETLQWALPQPETGAEPELAAPPAPEAAQPAEASAPDTPPQSGDKANDHPSQPTGKRKRGGRGAQQARQRLQADNTRLQTLAEARRDHEPEEWTVIAASPAAPDAPAETPQERRRREQTARQAQAETDAQHAAERRAAAAAQPTPRVTGQADTPKRKLKPIRATWSADQTWRVVREKGPAKAPASAAPRLDRPRPGAPRPGTPRWLWPVVGALAALVLLAAVVRGVQQRQVAAQPALAPAAASAKAGACCDVPFTLRGKAAQGKTARLSVESAPVGTGLQAGQALGTAPGTVHLPAPGSYRLRVSADGFVPATLTISAPVSRPVTINLGP